MRALFQKTLPLCTNLPSHSHPMGLMLPWFPQGLGKQPCSTRAAGIAANPQVLKCFQQAPERGSAHRELQALQADSYITKGKTLSDLNCFMQVWWIPKIPETCWMQGLNGKSASISPKGETIKMCCRSKVHLKERCGSTVVHHNTNLTRPSIHLALPSRSAQWEWRCRKVRAGF